MRQLEILAFYSHMKDTKQKNECKKIVKSFQRTFSNLSSFSARKWHDEWRASGPGAVRTRGHIHCTVVGLLKETEVDINIILPVKCYNFSVPDNVKQGGCQHSIKEF